MQILKIFIADDHPMIRSGIKSILANCPHCTIVGEADGGKQAISSVIELKPDIVIMDISMPDLNGIAATRRMTAELPGIKIIILSMHTDIYNAIDAFRAGALAYVLKDSATDELLEAIKKVSSGQKYASPAVAAELLNDFVHVIKKDQVFADPFDSLTGREREVLKLIAEGLTNKKIAEKLFISLATVKTHRANLMRKLKATDAAALIKIAIKKGLAQSV